MAAQKWVLQIDGDSTGAQTAITGLNAKTVALGNILSNIAAAAFNMAKEAVAGLEGELLKCVDAASQSEQSQTALAAVMKNAGIYTREAFQRNLDYASSLQLVTTYSDEEINSIQKQFIAFGLQGKALDDAVLAATDLAVKTGDLTSAGDLMARTIGTTTNALARQGIQVSDTTDKQERARQVVAGITALYGGQAAAAAGTFGGQVKILKNVFDELYEELGRVIISSDSMKIVFADIKSVLMDATKYVKEHKQELTSLTTDGIVYAVQGLKFLIEALGFVAVGFSNLGKFGRDAKYDILTFGDAITTVWSTLLHIDASAILAQSAKLKDGLTSAGEEAKNSQEKLLGFITTLTGGLDKLVSKINETRDAHKENAAALEEIIYAGDDVVAKTSEQDQALIDLARGYTDEQQNLYDKQKISMADLLASNKITQQEYNDWCAAEGTKVKNVEAKKLTDITTLYKQMYTTIYTVSKTQSDLILNEKKNSMAAMEDAFKSSLSSMLDSAIDAAVKNIGITSAEEIGKASMTGFLNPLNWLLIPLIAAASTAAKALIHTFVGFSEGGIVGPGGSRIPLPAGLSGGGADNAIAAVRTGEVIGTPAQLAGAGIGGIVVNFANYGAIASELDVSNLGNLLGEAIQNKLRGSL